VLASCKQTHLCKNLRQHHWVAIFLKFHNSQLNACQRPGLPMYLTQKNNTLRCDPQQDFSSIFVLAIGPCYCLCLQTGRSFNEHLKAVNYYCNFFYQRTPGNKLVLFFGVLPNESSLSSKYPSASAILKVFLKL